MFFLAISMVGTDFSMIGQLFPHRARTEIKNKFKKEERENSWRIDKAFRKKAADQRAPTDQSTEEELDSDVVEADSETAEKENEDCSNVVEPGADATGTKNNHKRKNWEGEEFPLEKAADGRSVKMSRPACEEDESISLRDCDGLVNGAQPATTDVDRLKRPESSIQGRSRPEIKPAQLSRGRFQRPTPNLGRRLAKKAPQPGEKTGDGSDGGEDIEESSFKGVAETKDPEGTKPKRIKGRGDTSTEELEEGSQERKLSKPTRRIPKLSQQRKQAGKKDSAMESTPASSSHLKGVATKGQGKQSTAAGRRTKPKPNLAACQRNGRTGKSKLVTLRASLPEENEEEEQDEAQPEDYPYPINPEEQNQVPAFVPLSLRSPQPVTMEVVETMEELEISVNVPDVIGTAESEHAFCSQPMCQGAQDEVVLSTDHQLDLLVDVIDFLSPEHGAVSEESYNEAARTLLTIRNPELISLAASGYSTEIVIDEESPHHIQLEDPEPREKIVSEPAGQLQCSTEHPQTVTSDLYITEASQSFTQSAYDVESMSLTPVAAPKFAVTVEESTVIPVGVSDSVISVVQSEPDLNPQSCETSSLGDSTVTEEPYKQERATPVSAGDAHSGALGPNPSVQNIPQGRRSRFPKPKPNLVRTARTTRVSTTQCTEKSAAVAIVEPGCLKTVDMEKKAMDNVPVEPVHENQEKARQDEATHAGDSQAGVARSDLSSQSVAPSRARWFPKPRPILDRDVRNTRVPPTLSTPATSTGDGRKEALGDTKAKKPMEGENSASSVNNMIAELANKNQGNTSAEDRKTEGQNITNSLVETEEVDRAYSTVILNEMCPAGEGEKAPETSASFNTVQEATSFHMEGDLSTEVSCQVTEDSLSGAIGQQSTFILTLFEVPPPLLGELESDANPPGVVTAELLSPLVFVNEQPASPPTQSETHSCYSLSVGAEHGQLFHLQDRDPPVPASEDLGGWVHHSAVKDRTGSSTGASSPTLMGPVDSCEKSISLTLVPVEESCFSEAGEEGTSKQSSPPLKMRKIPVRTRKGNLQEKPSTSTLKPEDPTGGDQIVFGKERLLPTPDPTSPRADAPHPLPNPAVQRTCTEPPTMPETSTAEESQSIVGWSDLPKLDGDSTAMADSAASSAYKEPQISHQAMPMTSSSPLTTTGRKPRGFLSFISNKSTAGPAGAPRPARPASQRPQVNTSRSERRRMATVNSAPSRVSPSTSQSGSASKLATTQVSEASQGESSCFKTSKTDKEPTSVSEYFFSDIFTQVEEPE
ncbi:hypothetical protein AAFF_G00337620 [Aldrovandia affinis]|uniref:Transcription factor TFIIIB component B'' Myb domain-containing protein n=1 Tax=Aldrovandia affinis TaxID=143900 RepID=A0AAD7SKU9_9TELE|nr:hypothetical protein AAFF_G00337620 [Aldrovandia affinis]